MRQIDEHCRKEATLGHPEQEADDIELGRGPNEAGQRRQQSPPDHDRADPYARAPAVREHCAGNLEQAQAEEQDPRAESKHLVGEVQLPRHVETREAHIDAINEGGHVDQEEKRKKPASDLAGSRCGRVRERERQVDPRHHFDPGFQPAWRVD